MTDNVPCNDMEPFQNPNCVPLEELKLSIKTDGIVKLIPALNEKWADKRYMLRYEAPEIYNNDGTEIMGAKEHWMEIIHYIIDDLKQLLSLPFYRFWSSIQYNSSILDTLVSFLQEAPPFFALEHFPNIPEILELLDTLSHHVLVTFARLVTNKESSKEYMSSAFLGTLLYDNYIFTVPIIYDLCQLYGRDNPETVKRILASLFKLQPQYNDDLQKSVPYFIAALENVENRFGKEPDFFNGDTMFVPKKGTETKKMTLFELEDLILYVLDIFSNITVLLKNYPPAIKLFHQGEFMNKIVSVYGSTIPEMYERLDELAFNDENIGKYTELKHCLDVSRVEILQLYRTVIYSPVMHISENLDKLNETELKEQIDDYLTVLLSNAIPEKEFIIDYDRFFPIQTDLDYLSTICSEIDTFKCDYIIQSVHTIIGNINSQRRAISSNAIPQPGPSGVQSKPLTESNNVENFPKNEGKTSKIGSVELASLITEVKDILSHLGEGFIELCLKHYNYDSASVINAILEDTLPPTLKELDYTLPHIPSDQEHTVAEDLIPAVQRLNLFNNDRAFDLAIKESTGASEVHKGKRKDKYRNVNELLNDKTDIKNARDIYDKYSLVVDDYDDEYDDTYDSHDVRGFVQDGSTEIDSRPFTMPRILRPVNKSEAMSEEESDNEEENSNPQNGRDNFVQNPEELRARAEQRRLSRGGKSSHGGNQNVVGNAKGKGQEKNVLVSRQKKNTHKATQANHNRRSGASWKRRQGMVPS